MVEIPENGQLDELSLPRLLIRLRDADFDGCLKLVKHRTQKSFRFASGGAVSAESNLTGESIGERLLAADRISREDHARLTSLMESDNCSESAALIKLGLTDSRELFAALRDQIRYCLLESIGWMDGTFSLDAEAAPPESALAFQPDLYHLLQEGIESHWAVERVFGELEPRLMQFAKSNSLFKSIQEKIPSDDTVLEVHRALDGTQTLWSALRLATTPRAMATTWVIDAAGGIDYCDEALEEKPDIPMEIEVVFQDIASNNPDLATRARSADHANATPSVAQKQATVSAAKQATASAADTATATPQSAAGASTGDASDLECEISQRFEQLDELDYYRCFELESDAAAIDIKKAYLLAAKRYHPDALARAGLAPEIRKKANKIFAKISKAYSTLSNPKQRTEYDASQSAGGGHIDTERLTNAETLYRKGEILLGLGNFKGAVEFLAPAVELWPDEADYQSALGWALYKKMPSEPERSREHLESAVSLNPKNATASHRLSLVLRTLGATTDADAWLRRARQLDPDIA